MSGKRAVVFGVLCCFLVLSWGVATAGLFVSTASAASEGQSSLGAASATGDERPSLDTAPEVGTERLSLGTASAAGNEITISEQSTETQIARGAFEDVFKITLDTSGTGTEYITSVRVANAGTATESDTESLTLGISDYGSTSTKGVSPPFEDGVSGFDSGGHTFDLTQYDSGEPLTMGDTYTFYITIEATEDATLGSTFRPEVEFTFGDPDITVAGSNPITASSGTEVVPLLSSVTTLDRDTNGRIDAARLDFNVDFYESYPKGGDYPDPQNWTIGGRTGDAFETGSSATDSRVLLTLAGGNEPGVDTAATDVTGRRTHFFTRGGHVYTSVASDDFDEIDGAAPVVTDATYRDSDDDGRVDRVDVTYSEDISGSSASPGDWSIQTAGDVGLDSVDGVTIAGSTAELAVTATVDATGGTTAPELRYDGSSITDGSNDAPAQTVTVADGIGPRATSAVYTDDNRDGAVDTVEVRYTEDVSTSTAVAADWRVVDGGTVGVQSVDEVSVVGSTVELDVTADTAVTGGGSDPEVGYDGSSVTDGTTDAPAQTVTATDSAAPVVVSGTYRDTAGDNTVDRVDVTFSESVTYGTFDASDWSVTENDLTNLAVDGLASGSGSSTLTLTASAATGVTGVGSGTGPTLDYAPGGSGTVSDGSNEAAGTASDTVLSDGISPVVVSGTYRDTDGDGTVDRVDVTFSESVTYGSFDASDWTVTDNDLPNLAVEGLTSGSGSTTLALSASADADLTGVGGGTEPTLDYAPGGSGTVTDGSNEAGTLSSPLSLSDGAAPTFASVTTRDTDTDGTVDQLGVVFTEAIPTDSVEAGDFTVGSHNNLNPSTTVGGLSGDDGDDAVSILLATGESADTAATPTLSYTSTGASSEAVQDAATNRMSDVTSAAASDGAAPVPMRAAYTDANADGTVDDIAVTFSETVDSYTTGATGTDDDWSLTPNAFTSLAVTDKESVSGAVVTLAVSADAETTGVDGTEPSIQYLPGGDGGVTDAAATEAVAGARSVTDAAAPVLVTASAFDTDIDGNVDEVAVEFSESLDDSSATESAVTGAFTVGGEAVTGVDDTTDSTNGQAVSNGDDPAVADDAWLTVVTDDTTVTGTEFTPVAFTQPGSRFGDGSGNDARSTATATNTLTTNDRAGPTVVAAVTDDTDADGNIDHIDITLSESLADGRSTLDTSTFSLGSGSVSVAETGTAGDETVSVDVTGLTGTDATPAVTLAAGKLVDGSGTAISAPTTFTGTTSAAAPVVETITTLDRDGDGNVDAATAVFSARMNDATVTAGDWALDGAAAEAVDTLDSANDDTLQFQIPTDATEVEGTGPADVTYTPGAVAGAGGNALATVDSDDVTEIDGATPTGVDLVVSNPGGRRLTLAARSNEQLATVQFDIDREESAVGTVTTVAEAGGGPWWYNGTYRTSSDGEFTVTLGTAADAAGNDAGGATTTVRISTDDPPEQRITVTRVESTDETTSSATDRDESRRTAVRIENARASDRLSVDLADAEPPAADGRDASESATDPGHVVMEGLDMTTRRQQNYDLAFETRAATDRRADESSAETATGTDTATATDQRFADETNRESAGTIRIDHSFPNRDVTDVTLRFRVRKSYLVASGIDPASVRLFRDEPSGWRELSTRVIGQDGDFYRFAADSPGLSLFAIGTPMARLEIEETTIAASPSGRRVGDPVTVTATVQNTGRSDGEFAAYLTADGSEIGRDVVSVPTGETRTIEISGRLDHAGTVALALNERSLGTIEIQPEPATTDTRPTTTVTGVETTTPTTATTTPTSQQPPTTAPDDPSRATGTATATAADPNSGSVTSLLAGIVVLTLVAVALLAWRQRN